MPNFIKSFLISFLVAFIIITLSLAVVPIVDIFLPFRKGFSELCHYYLCGISILIPFLWLPIHATMYPYIPQSQKRSTPTTSDTTAESNPEKTSPERDA